MKLGGEMAERLRREVDKPLLQSNMFSYTEWDPMRRGGGEKGLDLERVFKEERGFDVERSKAFGVK